MIGKTSLQETAGRHVSRRGAFSAGLTALAVAAVLVFNLLAAQLPEQWAQIDLTGSGIYNISETSQDYLAGLEDDVVIHVLTDKDTLDTRIVRFLDIYADLSDHLTLEYTDPRSIPPPCPSTVWGRIPSWSPARPPAGRSPLTSAT